MVDDGGRSFIFLKVMHLKAVPLKMPIDTNWHVNCKETLILARIDLTLSLKILKVLFFINSKT